MLTVLGTGVLVEPKRTYVSYKSKEKITLWCSVKAWEMGLVL